MANATDLAAHLANLTFIMDHHEKLGTTKNLVLVREFQYCHQDLLDQLEKDHEARKRQDDKQRREDRADLAHGRPRSG